MSGLEVHILACDYEDFLPWSLRHYRSFSNRIVVHHGGPEIPDDHGKLIASHLAELSPWDTGGQLNDLLAMELKNSCWKGTDADWVICVDCDELIYFPQGAEKTLAKYEQIGAAVIKPHGFDMYSETFPTTSGQIYDEVRQGAPSDKWYAKPVLFSPKRVLETGFGIGAHESNPTLANGRSYFVDHRWPKATPPTYLLHFAHGIGPPERVAAKLDAKRKRLSQVNEVQKWGNFSAGAVHVQEKLALILPNLVQVIP